MVNTYCSSTNHHDPCYPKVSAHVLYTYNPATTPMPVVSLVSRFLDACDEAHRTPSLTLSHPMQDAHAIKSVPDFQVSVHTPSK